MVELLEWVRLGVSVVALLFSVATFFYMLFDKRQRASVKSLEDHKLSVDKRLEEKEKRLSAVEVQIGKIPSRSEFEKAQERGRQEIVRIHERIDEINHGIKESQLMIGQLIGMSKGAKHD